ncbi:cytochrome c oxidase subunit II [Halomarina litorea]|uniref:cytochrome c oxidase subunit II n=1 Tax=Halomarina litorea TaxID=2961595 RepID=UPI0020C4A303|nr:cytochrome c oxidase subunit II [Halomarina sp. BCD28]
MYGTDVFAVLVQADGLIPRGSRAEVFEEIYWVFLVLGTLVGVVVISYMVYNAYKYRARAGVDADSADRPSLGELPSGGGKGRKLFLSLFISAIIVISLITWTYGTLLYIESPADDAFQDDTETMNVTVTGRQFIWQFEYPNGHRSTGELRVPKGTRVQLSVTSADVFHNFGVPGLRVKTDAIPGQTTDAWFLADEVGTYTAQCYELCGAGHSAMNAQVVVMEPEAFEEWYAGTGNGSSDGSGNGTNATNGTANIGVPA